MRVQRAQRRAALRRGMTIDAYLKWRETPEGLVIRRLKREADHKRAVDRIQRHVNGVAGLELGEQVRQLLRLGYHHNSVMQMLGLKLRQYEDALVRQLV
jgi:hypothetical protein